jgi:hypothetical protein
MDKNSMGGYNTILPAILMRYHLLRNGKIPTHANDTHRSIYFFRHILEFLSLRIQMCPHLQNNLHQLLYSRTVLRNHRFYLLDYRAVNV